MTLLADAAAAALTAKLEADEAARKAARTALIAQARTAVADVISPDVDPADLAVVPNSDPVVLTDGEVHLSVTDDGVHLVRLEDGQWRDLAGPLADLAALGVALEAQQ